MLLPRPAVFPCTVDHISSMFTCNLPSNLQQGAVSGFNHPKKTPVKTKTILHRQRPQIASTHPNCKKKQTRKELSICDHEERQAWEGPHRQPRAAQNGDHKGRQMKGDKAAVALQPFGDFGESLRSKNPYSFQLSGNNKPPNCYQHGMETKNYTGMDPSQHHPTQTTQKNAC